MSRSTSQEIAKYLQWRIREWVKSGRTARELAKLAGVSTAQVSELQNAGIGAGWKTAEGLAKAFGMTMLELMTVSTEWAEKQPIVILPSALVPRSADRRAVAAELAKEDGVSDEAIRAVLSESQDSTRSAVWWIMRMKRRDVDLVGEPVQEPQETVTRKRTKR